MANNASATANRVLAILIVFVSIAIVTLGGLIVRSVFITPEAPRSAIERDLEQAKAAVRTKPRDAQAHSDLGNVYFRMGNYDAAEVEFKRAISLNKMYLVAQFNLAMVYKTRGKTDLAITELNKLLKKYPADDAALFRLGELHMEKKQYTQAISAFRRAIKFNPIVADAHYSLAVAYEKTGKRAAAIKEYKQVVRYIPDHKAARDALKRLSKKK